MRIILTLAVLLLFIASCSETKSREDLLEDIEEAEIDLKKEIENETVFKERALKGGEAYKTYLYTYPDDSVRNPQFYNNAIQLYAQAGLYDTALVLVDSIHKKYPQSEYAANMQHFKAFYIFEQGLKDYDRAREAYLTFLNKYPQHELVTAVLFSLEHLGEDDETVLKKIREKTQLDSLQVPK